MFTALGIALIGAASAQDLTIKRCQDSTANLDATWSKARTVRIETAQQSGTGALVSPDGFIVTAAHIVVAPEGLTVAFEEGLTLPAKIVRVSETSDLAMLSVDARELPCFPVEPGFAEVGSDVLVIGSPGGKALTHSVSKGIVSAYRDADGTTMVQTDASINPGNSGGPMVGAGGLLLGIVSFKVAGAGVEGLGFSVAASNFEDDLSLAWGDETSIETFQAQARSTSAERFMPTPRVEPGPGVVIDTDSHYELKYRPSWGGMVASAVLAGACYGYARFEGSIIENDYGPFGGGKLDKGEVVIHRAAQVAGWTGALGGVALFGLSFRPSAKGEILIQPGSTP